MWGGIACLVLNPREIQFERILNNIARVVRSSLLDDLHEVAEEEVARVSLRSAFDGILIHGICVLVVEDLVNQGLLDLNLLRDELDLLVWLNQHAVVIVLDEGDISILST